MTGTWTTALLTRAVLTGQLVAWLFCFIAAGLWHLTDQVRRPQPAGWACERCTFWTDTYHAGDACPRCASNLLCARCLVLPEGCSCDQAGKR